MNRFEYNRDIVDTLTKDDISRHMKARYKPRLIACLISGMVLLALSAEIVHSWIEVRNDGIGSKDVPDLLIISAIIAMLIVFDLIFLIINAVLLSLSAGKRFEVYDDVVKEIKRIPYKSEVLRCVILTDNGKWIPGRYNIFVNEYLKAIHPEKLRCGDRCYAVKFRPASRFAAAVYPAVRFRYCYE